jgi:plasmid rolling circle replication initiator protein Rep
VGASMHWVCPFKKKSINKEFKNYDGYVDIRENSVGQCKNQKINENTERNCE